MAVSNEANILFNAKMGHGFAELLKEMNRLQGILKKVGEGGVGDRAFRVELPAAVDKYTTALKRAQSTMKAMNLESERMRFSKQIGRVVQPAEVARLLKEEKAAQREIKKLRDAGLRDAAKQEREKTRLAEQEGRSRIKAAVRQARAEQDIAKTNEAAKAASRVRYEQAQARLADKVIKFETGITAAVERSARAEERRLRALQGEVRASMKSGGVPLSSLESLPGGAVPFLGPNTVSNLKKVEGQAKSAARAVGEIGTQGKFAVRVLEAFVLYRGFVMLQQGAMSATRSMIDLEKQVALVQTQLSGGVGRAVITDRIMDVANTTGLAFADVAKAEYSVVSANIALGDSWRVLDLSAKAAVAGGLADVQTAFNAALAQVNAFGLGVEEFGRVYDLQFNLVKRGIFTYEQLANIVGEVSLAFANAGQDIETANSAIAAISQIFTGPQITEGATALKRLANQIAQTPEAFEKMGIAVADSDGNYRNFILILEDLKAALAGMSQTESQKVLHEMFPDERELRGARGALQTLDAMKDIYIEQQLALGDMEDKFKDVADTMDTRLGQLRNNMQEGFGTATDIFGGLLKAMNEMEKVLPGLTASMVSFGAAAAMVGIVGSYATGASMGHPGMSRAGAFGASMMSPVIGGRIGPMQSRTGQFLNQRIGRASSPLALGGYLVGGSIARGIGAGETEGGSFGGFATAVGTGTAMGSFGGVPGMAVGAGISAATYLFSAFQSASQEKARLAARTFYEAFVEELANNKGDAAKAIAIASGASGDGTDMFKTFIATRTPVAQVEAAYRSIVAKSGGPPLSQGGPPNPNMPYSHYPAGAFGNMAIGGTMTTAEVTAKARADFAAAIRTVTDFRTSTLGGENLSRIATQEGTSKEDARQRFLPAVTAYAVEQLGSDFSGMAGVITALVNKDLNPEKMTQVLDILFSEMPDKFAKLFDFLNDDSISSLKRPFEILAKGLEGDFSIAADVFSNLGAEGEKLAVVFARTAAIVDGFGKLKSLSELTIQGGRSTGLANVPFASPGLWYSANQSLLSKSGINVENVASIMQGELNRTLDRIQAMSGMGRDAAMAEYLMRGPAAEKTAMAAFEIPGATPLGEQLEAAAEMVASGFIPSLGFTADQLMGFSREFNDINRAIAKMNLLGEFQRLGVTLFGMPEDYMRGAMTTLLGSMQVGAEDLRSLFQDPTRLAELLANSFEFGDIRVDNSTNSNYVIRISGDIDSNPHNLAKIAEGILQQINIKSREAKRR